MHLHAWVGAFEGANLWNYHANIWPLQEQNIMHMVHGTCKSFYMCDHAAKRIGTTAYMDQIAFSKDNSNTPICASNQ